MSVPAPDAALRLAAIIESSDDAIVSKDLNGVITSWNRGAEQLFGYSASEAIGQSITMLLPPDRLVEEDRVLASIRRGERVEHFETVRWRKDGTLFDVSVTVSPIRDASGRVIGASKIARDITARKRIEGELRDLQQRLLSLAAAAGSIFSSGTADDVLSNTIALARSVFSADGYALWRYDEQGAWKVVKSVGVSDRFAQRVIAVNTGRPVPNRIEFSAPIVFEDVLTAPMIEEMRAAYQAEGIASMIVFPLAIRDRRSATLVIYSRRRGRFQDVDVQVGAALASIAAATLTAAELYEEQRMAREAADYARRQATFLAEAGTLLSASLDYEHTLAAVAQLAVPAIADWCAVDILGERGALQRLAVAHVDPAKIEFARALEERYPPDQASRTGVHEVVRTGRPVLVSRIDAALIDAAARDDEHRRVLKALDLTSYMCVPMFAHGRPFGAITFVSAESRREYTDADLRFAREIAARASLAVENARSYATAAQASRLKDEFLATLSHELRTPLNAVLGYTRMLRTGTMATDKMPAALDIVNRNATALKQIIEDVLDVSRIVSGRLQLAVVAVDLAEILHQAQATLVPAASAKGVRVEVVIGPSVPRVSGDPDRIRQIVWNLLSNAIKFTPGGGDVQMRLAAIDSHVEITVSDSGRGIAAEFLPFAFDRFRQADATFSREHGGLGLGLAIARQLTELHGGTIEATSAGLGRGATFIVRLPVMASPPEATDPPDAITPATTRGADRAPVPASPPRLEGVQVLAVDDEPDSLELVRALLAAAGATVTTARTGADALSLLTHGRHDVLIADLGMPGMDGLQLIRAVRQLAEPHCSTPAAALTAYARPQDRIVAIASGFHMHLVKPIDPLELVVAVSALAERRLGA